MPLTPSTELVLDPVLISKATADPATRIAMNVIASANFAETAGRGPLPKKAAAAARSIPAGARNGIR
jgi:hypothetical protein